MVCSPDSQLTIKTSRGPNEMVKRFEDLRGSCTCLCTPLPGLETEGGCNFQSTFHSPFSAVEFSPPGTVCATSSPLQEPGMKEMSSIAKSLV